MLDNPVLREALPVMNRLTAKGFHVYFVGGCVRDVRMGRRIADVDIATSAKPEEVLAIFPHSIPTGLKHGTVTVVEGTKHYEITTFRKESEYEKHRRPAKVEFIRDLEGDLLRRDFTINAMAMNAEGELYDPYRGERDLRAGFIRCVGDADSRFQEDALRMLRAIRFASAFNFAVSKSTWRALLRHRQLLKCIAMERVGAELDKMLAGPSPVRALNWLGRSRLLHYTRVTLPYDASNETCCGLSAISGLPETDWRWAAVMIGLQVRKGQARTFISSLAFGRQRVSRIMSVIGFHEAISEKLAGSPIWNESDSNAFRLSWTMLVLTWGLDAAACWLAIAGLMPAAVRLDNNTAAAFTVQASEWLSAMPAAAHKDLAVNGSELSAAAAKDPGPWLKAVLDHLLLLCAAGIVANTKEALLGETRSWLERES